MTSAFSWQNFISLCPTLFLLQGQICLLLQVFIDFLLLHGVGARGRCKKPSHRGLLAPLGLFARPGRPQAERGGLRARVPVPSLRACDSGAGGGL